MVSEVDLNPLEHHDDQKTKISGKSLIRRVNFAIDKAMKSLFYRHGFLVASHPYWTMISSVLLCGLCMIGMINFRLEFRAEKLWVPQDTASLEQKDFADQHFGSSLRRVSTIYTPGDHLSTSSLVSRNAILQLIQAVNISYNTVAEYQGQFITLTSLCFNQSNSDGIMFCSTSSVLDIFYDPKFLTYDQQGVPDYLLTIQAKVLSMSDSEVSAKIALGPYVSWNRENLIRDNVVSGLQLNQDKTQAIAVDAYKVMQFLENNLIVINGEEKDPMADAWEQQFSTNMNNDKAAAPDLAWVYETLYSEMDSLDQALFSDIMLFVIGFFLLILYVVFFLGEFNFTTSRMVAAVMLFVSIGLAIGSAFGLASAFGLFFGPVHQILPLLYLGLGADDGFVLIRELDLINRDDSTKRKSPKEKIALMLSKAGTAITVTSFTNSMVFFISATTQIPALKQFALWAGIGIVLIYFFSITFFVAYLVVDETRLMDHRFDCFPCKKQENVKENNWCGLPPGVLERAFENYWIKFLLFQPIRFLIPMLSIALFGVCVWGTTQLQLNYNFAYFYPDDSMQRVFYDANQLYFNNTGIPVYVYSGKINYEENQQLLLSLCQPVTGSFAKDEYMRDNSVQCWYFSMRQYYQISDGNYFSPGEFYSKLFSYLDGDGARYQSDFDIKNEVVIASRFPGEMIYLENNEEEMDAMDSIRKLVDHSGLPDTFAYSPAFIFWEQYFIIRNEAVLTISLSLAMVAIVSLLLVGHPIAALITVISVGFSIVDIMGIIYFWNININDVSIISLSIAVGLTVDFTVHIVRSFMEHVGSRKDRIRKAIGELGPPVLHSGISTFLAIIMLAAASSYIFQTFFKIFFLILFLGMVHGLIFTPVVLSFFGPESFYNDDEEKQMTRFLSEKASQKVFKEETYDNENLSDDEIIDKVGTIDQV